MFDIILCGGRGVQKVGEVFKSTDYLEMLASDGTHQLVREPVDDNSARCLIGGGRLNVEAAAQVYRRHGASMVLFAYGNTRTEQLRAANAPFESEVMQKEFQVLIKGLGKPEMHGWTKNEVMLCNSRLEIRHVLDFAVEREMKTIGIVTVEVHMPRMRMFVAEFKQEARYRELDIQFFVSEDVLLEHDWDAYAPVVLAGRFSQAYARNRAREDTGIRKLLSGNYIDEKPPIVATT